MPHKRKGSPFWWVKITPPGGGESIRRSTGTTDWKEAQALEGKWRAELYRQQAWGEDPARPFAEVAAAYLQHHIDEGARSLDDMKRRVAKLYDFFGAEKDMANLAGQDVRDFIAWRRVHAGKAGRTPGPATINRELDVLGAMITYANVELEWCLPNPVKGRSLKEPEPVVRWITKAEAARLIQCAEQLKDSDRIVAFITLGLHTGCRLSELTGLEWRRVDMRRGLMLIEPENDKAGKRRTVPLNAVSLQALRSMAAYQARFCPGTPWVFAKRNGARFKAPRGSFTKACQLAGIRNFRIHDMRHTCASWMVSEGVPLIDVKEVLGHSTITMTEKYSHLAPHRAREAVAKLANYRDPAEDRQTQSGHTERPMNVVEGLIGRKRRA